LYLQTKHNQYTISALSLPITNRNQNTMAHSRPRTNHSLLTACVIAVSLVLSACTVRPPAPPASSLSSRATPAPFAGIGYIPQLTLWPCPFHLAEPDVEGQTFSCGRMTVPEDRSRPYGPKVEIAYAVLKSSVAPAQRDAVLYLEDGPGISALELAPLRAAAFALTRADRDLILFDVRGTGFSTRMGCEQWIGRADNPYAVCAAELRSRGRDVSNYSTTDIASDAADLLSALGYRTANLHGVGYGARVVQRIVVRQPSRVRSAVLDLTPTEPANLTAMGDLASASAAAQPHAPDKLLVALLRELFEDDAQKRDALHEQFVAMAESALGKKELFGFIDARFEGEDGARLRGLVDQLNEHELARLFSDYNGRDVFKGGFTRSGFLAVQCGDTPLPQSQAVAEAKAEVTDVAPARGLDLAECAELGVSGPRSTPADPPKSKVPALLLTVNGDARHVADDFATSVVMSLADQVDGTCAMQLAHAFIADPSASAELNPNCTHASDERAQTNEPTATGMALRGTSWHVTSFGVPTVEWPIAAGTTVTITFGRDDVFTGATACSPLAGTYSDANNALAVGAVTAQEAVCEPEHKRQHHRLLRALAAADSYDVQADALTITYNEGLGIIRAVRSPGP
jgi:pimeloyl-ACP methyl ester carboxylesterase/heat shock protein HslJ